MKKRKKVEGRSYNLEVSSAHQLIFVNKVSSVIEAYSSASCELRFQLTGYLQKNFLTRMSAGGPEGSFLAVTSEDGHICLYNFKNPDLFTRIRVSNSPVNCVAWIGSELYMGCDSGYIEIWVNSCSFKPPTWRNISGKLKISALSARNRRKRPRSEDP